MAPPQGYVQITVTPGSLPGRDAAFNATALDVTSKRSFSGPAASRLVLLSTLMELAGLGSTQEKPSHFHHHSFVWRFSLSPSPRSFHFPSCHRNSYAVNSTGRALRSQFTIGKMGVREAEPARSKWLEGTDPATKPTCSLVLAQ